MSSETITNPHISVDFWDSVSEIYGENQMTHQKADGEMKYLLSQMNEHGKISNIISLGVADGCRDPYQMLEQQTCENVYINDISPKLLKVAYNRVKSAFTSTNIIPHCCSMDKITDHIHDKFDNLHIYIGVYSSKYIKLALSHYYDERDIIGTQFEISYLTLDRNTNQLIKSCDKITFDICDHNSREISDKLVSFTQDKNFIAFSIFTDKNFISHYYSFDGLKDIASIVFGDKINITSIDERYLVLEVEHGNLSKEADGYCLLTSLNNVLGNVPYEYQIGCLQTISYFMQ